MLAEPQNLNSQNQIERHERHASGWGTNPYNGSGDILAIVCGRIAGVRVHYPDCPLITGFITLGFAIVTMGVTLVSKPSYKPLRVLSIALVGLIFLQGILGFVALGGATTVILVHFTNALVIYGIAVSAIFFARAWNRMPLTGKQGPVLIALVVSAAVWGAFFAAEFFLH